MKKILITLEDLFSIPTAEVFNSRNYTNLSHVSIDSRTIKSNSIYFALKGEKLDGHSFINDAVNKGAKAVFLNQDRADEFKKLKCTVIAVKNTTTAFGALAHIWRKKISAKVIGITGSNGKTTTKDTCATILAEKFNVVSTYSNNNNHIGVPLTIFDANENTEALVLELGTNHFGEIEYASAIAKPDYSIVTNIGASHLEFLIDLDGVTREKEPIYFHTQENNGLCLINNDDPYLKPFKHKFKNHLTYGFKSKVDVKGVIEGFDKEGRTKLNIQYDEKELKLVLPIYGKSNAENILASVSLAYSMGMTNAEIKSGVNNIKAVKQRLNVRKYQSTMLIDDTYNANPESMTAAFDLLKTITLHKTKIAVIGDMFELGKDEKIIHASLSKSIKKNKINRVFMVGNLMKSLAEKLKEEKIHSNYFSSREELKEVLSGWDFSDSVVLVKGSRGMKMEEFVKVIEDDLRG